MMKAVRRWWRRPDHYYWVTSFLAARDSQAITCQLVAATVFTMGAVPVAILWSPVGPHATWSRAVSVGLTVCSLILTLGWLRRTWPTRWQSGAFVVICTVAIATACLLQPNPLVGILLATGFAALNGYISIFHTARYMAFTLVVAHATAIVLAFRIADAGDLVWAVTALVFVALVNTVVPGACQAVVHMLDINVLNADIEPLTGLLNRDAFYREAGNLVSRSRDDDKQLVILVINLDNVRLLSETDGVAAGDRARVAIGQILRETTRHNAIVGQINHDEFVIADTFPSTDSFPLVERVRGTIATTPPRLTASIGVVSTPMRGLGVCPTQELLDELIAIGTTAMYDARRSGGNQARYVVCSRPTALKGSTGSQSAESVPNDDV
jgi:diguanylate cyclase (GGDEF)-like protein